MHAQEPDRSNPTSLKSGTPRKQIQNSQNPGAISSGSGLSDLKSCGSPRLRGPHRTLAHESLRPGSPPGPLARGSLTPRDPLKFRVPQTPRVSQARGSPGLPGPKVPDTRRAGTSGLGPPDFQERGSLRPGAPQTPARGPLRPGSSTAPPPPPPAWHISRAASPGPASEGSPSSWQTPSPRA